MTSRDASDEVANLACALNFSAPDTSLPSLPVIAEPPIEVCTLDDIFEGTGTGLPPLVNSEKAMQVAQAQNSAGIGNESYDFYLLLKDEKLAGWQIPDTLVGK